jgi:hypothetical protein
MADTPASKRNRKEWNDAIAEYLELERKAGRDSVTRPSSAARRPSPMNTVVAQAIAVS